MKIKIPLTQDSFRLARSRRNELTSVDQCTLLFHAQETCLARVPKVSHRVPSFKLNECFSYCPSQMMLPRIKQVGGNFECMSVDRQVPLTKLRAARGGAAGRGASEAHKTSINRLHSFREYYQIISMNTYLFCSIRNEKFCIYPKM